MVRRTEAAEEASVGFDANRRYRDDKSRDIWILVAAIVVLTAAILWGIGVL